MLQALSRRVYILLVAEQLFGVWRRLRLGGVKPPLEHRRAARAPLAGRRRGPLPPRRLRVCLRE